MTEESTIPDPAELVLRAVEAMNRRDLDGWLSIFGPGSVWDMSPMGLGSYEGSAAIREFAEDWLGAWEEFELAVEEFLDLGNGVVLATVFQHARMAGSRAEVQMRYVSVNCWHEGIFLRIRNYTDADEARAAAERLAEQRA
jgi:ketosteroid isomerase-like protein